MYCFLNIEENFSEEKSIQVVRVTPVYYDPTDVTANEA